MEIEEAKAKEPRTKNQPRSKKPKKMEMNLLLGSVFSDNF